MAGGIIEYLAEGAWTKRLHPGWAAQSGIRAADLARAGFVGPRTVLEGTHGFFHAFARTAQGDFAQAGRRFRQAVDRGVDRLQALRLRDDDAPYIDCARRIGARVKPEEIEEIVCEAAEGTVHRLWEPLAAKRRPPNGYAAKFSQPYCIAAGLVLGNAGLDAFSDERVRDPRLLAVAARVRYEIDPHNPYPAEFTGHLRVRLQDGRVLEERQAHFRGGAHEPLSRRDLEEKFRLNCAHGGWPSGRVEQFLAFVEGRSGDPLDLSPFR